MADTMRGDFGDTPCSDCGERGGVYLKHWGPLVPPGAVGFFDGPCFFIRRHERDLGRVPRPLGQKWPQFLREAARLAAEEGTSVQHVLASEAARYRATQAPGQTS